MNVGTGNSWRRAMTATVVLASATLGSSILGTGVASATDTTVRIWPSSTRSEPTRTTTSPGAGSGTGTAPVFIPSASIDEDKGLTASGTGTPACAAGSLVRTAELSAVYYCGADAKRYVFPNEKVFFSWYADFSKVQVVSPAVLSSLPIGGNVTYKPGSRMIKVESDPKTYLVSRGGQLRHVTTEAIATAIYGASWNTKIDDLPVGFFTDYTVIAPIVEADLQ